jgi:hypothetical protein
MSGAFGGRTQVTTYSGLQVQTTTAMTPIPVVWGETLLTPTVIDYEGFSTQNKRDKGVGKGGGLAAIFGSGEKVYYADILAALCEGPIAGSAGVYQTGYTPISLAAAGLGLMDGALGQAPWSYWLKTYPSKALGYSGTAYLYAEAFDLGPSATFGSLSVIVQGLNWQSGYNGIDADPSLVIQDFLTNWRYGVGFTAIDESTLEGSSGDSSLKSYCFAVGLAFSPALVSREAANTILARWLELLNCTCVWSSGLLKFIPRGDQPLSGNGWTWNPDLTIQANFTDDGYYAAKGQASEPVKISIASPYELENYLTLEITARDNNYNTGPVSAWDQASIDRYGLLLKPTVTAHEFCDPASAQIAAQLMLQRGLYIRRTFSWKASWEFCWLDPMDLVTISDSRIGLSQTIVRITGIEEDAQGILTFTAEEFPAGVATAVPYPFQAPSNGAPDTSVAPQPVNAPVIFEPPAALTNGEIQVWAAVSPQYADPNWGSAIVNASLDGSSYSVVDSINGPSVQGVTTAALPSYSGANPDNTNTLSVDLTMSGGALASTTAANAAGGATALYIGGEILSYTTATLTAAHVYALTGLYRGLYGSGASGAVAGAPAALISGPLVRDTLPSTAVGETLSLKFQSVNIFGLQEQSLADCTPYEYVVTGLASAGWKSFSPTWTGIGGTAPTLGDGTITGSYSLAASESVSVNIILSIGSTTALGTSTHYTFSAPKAAAGAATGTYLVTNSIGLQVGYGTVTIDPAETVFSLFDGPTGLVGASTYALVNGDVIVITITYQAA